MTDKQINFRICEIIGDDPHWKCARDYCNDLNAMHEAEEIIIREAKENDYWFYLGIQTGMPQSQSDRFKIHYFDAVRATARQRAEAFLRTLGKWEEAK